MAQAAATPDRLSLERKASVRPSGDSSTWYSIASFVRTRRAAPPSAGASQICHFPLRSEAKRTERPSCVKREQHVVGGIVGEPPRPGRRWLTDRVEVLVAADDLVVDQRQAGSPAGQAARALLGRGRGAGIRLAKR